MVMEKNLKRLQGEPMAPLRVAPYMSPADAEMNYYKSSYHI